MTSTQCKYNNALSLSLLRNNCKILVVRNLMLYCSPSNSWVNEMAEYYHMDWLFKLDAGLSVSRVMPQTNDIK